jgi:hypothetical protein
VEGREPRQVEPVAEPSAPAPEAPLELVERPPRGDLEFELTKDYRPGSSPKPRRWWPLVVVPLVLALGLAIVVVTRPTPTTITAPSLPAPIANALPEEVVDALPSLAGPPLIIDSTPGGATIVLPDRRILGTTPWAGDNPFLVETKVRLTLPGHAPATLRVPGAKEASLHVRLKAR